ncbi:MAG: tyrosine-type recombinase/integrase [Oscillospiraceae bacterium]
MTDIFNTYLNKMISDKKSKCTITAYQADIEQMLEVVGKDEVDISYMDLIDWKASISNLASASVSRKVVSIRNYFEFLKNNGVIEINPAKNLKGVHIENKQSTYIPMQEAIKLLDVGKNPRDKAIVAVYLSTGVRVQELINIKLSDYQADRLLINTKGNKERIIYLNEDCRKYVDDYLTVRKDGIDNLFVSNQHTVMDRKTISKTLKVLANKCGLPTTITNHDLRHSFVSNVCDNYDVQVACIVVNHASIATTMRYCHKTDEQIKNVMQGIKL